MSTHLGTAYLSIVAEASKIAPELKKTFGAAGDAAGKEAGKKGGLTLQKGLKLVAGAASVLGIGSLIGTAISGGMARAINIENAQAKLSGLGHSADSVAQIMDSALKSVSGTAYGLGDAASVAAVMSASGIKNGEAMTQTLKTVADTAAISGRSLGEIGAIFSKVAAKGKLDGQSLNQLMGSGIPVLEQLGRHLGKTQEEVGAMVSAGKIDFETFQAAMQGAMGGAALKTGETYQGALANVKAALGRLGATFMTPALQAAKSLFNAAIPAIDSITSKIKPLINAFTELGSGKSLSEIFGEGSKIAAFIQPIVTLMGLMNPLGMLFKTIATASKNSGEGMEGFFKRIPDYINQIAAQIPKIIDGPDDALLKTST
ncbi:MAG: tape measure protein, partial [Propionibacteriaceae bacterium]|nr:tape measure protein [Propionibacteriaceae bacterium]